MGIWTYAEKLKPFVEKKFRLTLSEGQTPLQENPNIAKFLGVEKIYLKREDLNPTGSHKDRGLAFQISAHLQDGKKEFAISSSGNSAISAVHLLKNREEILHIFLSEKISQKKLTRLKNSNTNLNIHFSKKPLSDAFKFTKEKNNITFLRGSTDIYGYEGFKTIAWEIQNADFDSIFLPTSSGTTAKGIFEAMEEKKPFYILQTTKVNTLVKDFNENYKLEKKTLADAIVDRVGHRKEEIKKIILQTQGNGLIISNEEILEAQEILKKEGIITSNESAMNIAGIKKAKMKDPNIKKPLCIFTGTQ